VIDVALLERLNEWNYHLGEVVRAQLQSGSIGAVFAVFAAGVVTSLTPCVYPVYPVTVTYIGGSAAGSRRRAFALSVVYVLGLATVYAALGVISALLGKTFGQLWQSPWVFGAVGLLLIAFGLSMFDVFTIGLPSRLMGLQGEGVRRGGYLGALLIGVAAAFVTAPCTAPVLGALLIAVAGGGNVVWGGFLLFVFALGIGLLLLLLGVFAGLLSSLPRPGPWMNLVKWGFGTLMVLVGLYFLWQAWGLARTGGPA
jgi:thiol:disulfide interchange protein